MVLGIIVIVALIGLALTFRNEIKDAFADFRKEPTEQEVERTERGAVENTQAFILGEEGLANLKEQSAQNKIAIDKFISEAQANLTSNITGVSETLVQAQKNLETFAQESQANIVKTVDDSSKAFQTSISGIGENINKFFADTSLNIQNIFGGQAVPKAVATTIPTSPVLTTKQGTPVIDLSFLTSVETLEGQGSKVETEEAEMIVQTDRVTSSRFGGSGSLR